MNDSISFHDQEIDRLFNQLGKEGRDAIAEKCVTSMTDWVKSKFPQTRDSSWLQVPSDKQSFSLYKVAIKRIKEDLGAEKGRYSQELRACMTIADAVVDRIEKGNVEGTRAILNAWLLSYHLGYSHLESQGREEDLKHWLRQIVSLDQSHQANSPEASPAEQENVFYSNDGRACVLYQPDLLGPRKWSVSVDGEIVETSRSPQDAADYLLEYLDITLDVMSARASDPEQGFARARPRA